MEQKAGVKPVCASADARKVLVFLSDVLRRTDRVHCDVSACLNCWWDQIVGEWGHSLAVTKGQRGPCSLRLPSLKEDGWEVSVSKDTCFCMKSAFPLKIWKAIYRRWLNVGTKIGCLCHTPGALSILGLVLWAVAFLQRSVWYSLIELLIADNDTVEWWPLIRRHTSRASNLCGNSAY